MCIHLQLLLVCSGRHCVLGRCTRVVYDTETHVWFAAALDWRCENVYSSVGTRRQTLNWTPVCHEKHLFRPGGFFLQSNLRCLIWFQSIGTVVMETAHPETFLITGGCGYFGFRFVSIHFTVFQWNPWFLPACVVIIWFDHKGVQSVFLSVGDPTNQATMAIWCDNSWSFTY